MTFINELNSHVNKNNHQEQPNSALQNTHRAQEKQRHKINYYGDHANRYIASAVLLENKKTTAPLSYLEAGATLANNDSQHVRQNTSPVLLPQQQENNAPTRFFIGTPRASKPAQQSHIPLVKEDNFAAQSREIEHKAMPSFEGNIGRVETAQSTKHRRVTRSTNAAPEFVPLSVESRAKPLAMQAMRDAFISYVKNNIDRRVGNNLSDALLRYLELKNHQGSETKHAFSTDVALQRYLANKLGNYYPDSDRANDIDPHYQNAIADQLVTALTQEIDFSEPSPLYGTTYNGHSFKGVVDTNGSNGSVSILSARNDALRFLTFKIQQKFNTNHVESAALAKLQLQAMAPELAFFSSNDPALPGIKYGSKQWGQLLAGVVVAKNLGVNLDGASIDAVKQLGISSMENAASTVNQNNHLKHFEKYNRIPLSSAILMRMADARGHIDLNTLNAQNDEQALEKLDAFVASEFKNDLAILDAIVTLQQTIPGRRGIAEKILREKGEDPYRRVSVTQLLPGADSSGESPMQTTSRTLIDSCLDNNVWKWPATSLSNAQDKALCESVGNAIEREFKEEFEKFKEQTKNALSVLFKAQLQAMVGDAINNADNTYRALPTISMAYRRGADPANASYLSPIPALDPNSKEVESKNAIFFVVNVPNKGNQRFVFLKNEKEKGLQELPKGKEILEWVAENESKVFDERDIEEANRWKQSLGKKEFKQSLMSPKNLDEMVAKVSGNYVRDHIHSQYEDAYGRTDFEKTMHTFFGTVVPFYDLAQDVKNWNYLSNAERFGAVVGGAIETAGFVTLIAGTARLFAKGTKLLFNASRQGFSAALKGGFKAGFRPFIKMMAHGAPKLGRQAGVVAASLVDAVLPFGLPGGDDIKVVNRAQLKQAAADLTKKFGADDLLTRQLKTIADNNMNRVGNRWTVTDPSQIYMKNGKPYSAVSGKEYRVAQLDGEEFVWIKEHRNADNSIAYATEVNPRTDQSFGAILYPGSDNKLYRSDQFANAQLQGYAVDANIAKPVDGMPASQIPGSHIGGDGYLYIKIGDGSATNPIAYYRIEKFEDGSINIVHPRIGKDNTGDIVFDPLEFAVERVHEKWRLLPTNATPKKFRDLAADQIDSWQFMEQGERFMVVRLKDSDRVVPLKSAGGKKYIEIDWETGKRHTSNRYSQPIYENADGTYSRQRLSGGQNSPLNLSYQTADDAKQHHDNLAKANSRGRELKAMAGKNGLNLKDNALTVAIKNVIPNYDARSMTDAQIEEVLTKIREELLYADGRKRYFISQKANAANIKMMQDQAAAFNQLPLDEQIEGVRGHVVTGNGRYDPVGGIVGAHNEIHFNAALAKHRGTLTDAELGLKETPHPELLGIKMIEYNSLRKNNGKVTVYKKTVYDPSKISDAEYKQLGVLALAEAKIKFNLPPNLAIGESDRFRRVIVPFKNVNTQVAVWLDEHYKLSTYYVELPAAIPNLP